MRAFLKNNRHAPRKIRLIARAVIGKDVSVALSEYSMMPHKGAKTLEKLIRSAVANAIQKDTSLTEADLKIENITVDKGITYTRYMPRAFGRATPLRKECSHIRVILARKNEAGIEKKESKTKTTKEVASKKPSTEKKENKTTAQKQTKDKKEATQKKEPAVSNKK
jgi:large subunit ribosomal protein L22